MRSNIIRNTGRALVVGAACLALAGSAASSASASGLVKLSPGSGAAGSSIKVSGSLLPLPHGGNIVSEQIGIYFDQKLEATSSTGAMGRFSATIITPACAPSGWHRVTVIGRVSRFTAAARFMVLPNLSPQICRNQPGGPGPDQVENGAAGRDAAGRYPLYGCTTKACRKAA